MFIACGAVSNAEAYIDLPETFEVCGRPITGII